MRRLQTTYELKKATQNWSPGQRLLIFLNPEWLHHYQDVPEVNEQVLWNTIRSVLKDREILALELRFGRQSVKMMTWEQVGMKFGLTRERARQMTAKALRKLHHPSRWRGLLKAVSQDTRNKLEYAEREWIREFNEFLEQEGVKQI